MESIKLSPMDYCIKYLSHFSALHISKFYKWRVWLLFGTLAVIALLSFIEDQFKGQDLHSLSGSYGDNSLEPEEVVKGWKEATRSLAKLDVFIDTFLFIPAYTITIRIWCWFFAHKTLFIYNKSNPLIGYYIAIIGKVLANLVFVTAAADVAENIALFYWIDKQEIIFEPFTIKVTV